ncbi:hypothetical protein JCM10213_008906 [Rhodosporidiobolus nylandii]
MAPWTTAQLLVTYGTHTHSIRVERDSESFRTWSRFQLLVRNIFGVQQYETVLLEFLAGGKVTVVSSEDSFWRLRDAIHQQFAHGNDAQAAQGLLLTRLLVVCTGPKPTREHRRPQDQRVDIMVDIKIRLGSDGECLILSFPGNQPLNMGSVLERVREVKGLVQPPEELHLQDDDGSLVRLAREADWDRIGWPRAKQIFIQGKEAGGWRAATFVVEDDW